VLKALISLRRGCRQFGSHPRCRPSIRVESPKHRRHRLLLKMSACGKSDVPTWPADFRRDGLTAWCKRILPYGADPPNPSRGIFRLAVCILPVAASSKTVVTSGNYAGSGPSKQVIYCV